MKEQHFDWHMAQARLGELEWLRPGEYERAESILDDLQILKIPRLRTGLSWADWHTTDGREWFNWLIPKVAQQGELLPCFTYTPPSLGIEAKTSSPPRKMGFRCTLDYIDAVGLHSFPETWEFDCDSWSDRLDKIRQVTDKHELAPEIWITEVGYSTWRHDEIMQVKTLTEALTASFDRVYWYSGYDLHPHESHQDGFHKDERHYHFGLKAADGRPKLIYRVWQDSGPAGLHRLTQKVRLTSTCWTMHVLMDCRPQCFA